MRLPDADLERLRAVAIFPEDFMHLLYSLSTGYLIETGLSDSALSGMLCALARSSGYPGAALQAVSATNVTDHSLYAGLPLDLLDPLVVPDFPFPVLLDEPVGGAGAVSWSAVAKITERTVFVKLGLSATALRAIDYLWQLRERAEAVAKSAVAGLPTAAYLSFGDLLDRYLDFAVAGKYDPTHHPTEIERCHRVLRGRLRLIDGHRWTLLELGKSLGVSRERVRQVESQLLAKLKSPATLRHLDYLWHLLDRMLASGGGARYARELALSLQRMHDWSSPPTDEALAAIMEFSPRYRVVWDPPIRVTLSSPCCVGCAISTPALLRAVETTENGELSFGAALETSLAVCREGRCPELRKISAFSHSLLHFMADSASELAVRNGSLHLRLPEFGATARRARVLENILRGAADGGIHFTKVHRRFNLMLPDQAASAQRIYSLLSNWPWAVLWGQGTFKHRDLVQIPDELVREIQIDVAQRLDSDDIPFLCLNGVIFENYAPQLRAKGVPNPPALYSCMRIVGSATLVFEEYPYVLKKDGPRSRVPISSVLECFLSRHPVVVTPQQLRAFAELKLGVPAAQVGLHTKRIPNLLRIKDLRLHLSNVPAVSQQLEKIAAQLPEPQRRGRPLEQRAYSKNLAACKAMGLTHPRHLVCLIDHFSPGRIDWAQADKWVKPAPGKSSSRPAAQLPRPRPGSLRGEVLNYLEEQGKPCKTKELLQLFHAGSTTVPYSYVADKKWVLWYSKDAVIARGSLDWTDEKQAAIEALAQRYLERRAECDKPYGLCSEIFRHMGGELPSLPPHLSWTPVLLHDLLGAGSRFHAPGRQRDVFLAKNNPDGFATVEDLIHHVLLKDYGGTAPRTAFITAMRKSGLTSANVPICLQGKDHRIIVEGDFIRAAVPGASGNPSDQKSLTTEGIEVHEGTQRKPERLGL